MIGGRRAFVSDFPGFSSRTEVNATAPHLDSTPAVHKQLRQLKEVVIELEVDALILKIAAVAVDKIGMIQAFGKA